MNKKICFLLLCGIVSGLNAAAVAQDDPLDKFMMSVTTLEELKNFCAFIAQFKLDGPDIPEIRECYPGLTKELTDQLRNMKLSDQDRLDFIRSAEELIVLATKEFEQSPVDQATKDSFSPISPMTPEDPAPPTGTAATGPLSPLGLPISREAHDAIREIGKTATPQETPRVTPTIEISQLDQVTSDQQPPFPPQSLEQQDPLTLQDVANTESVVVFHSAPSSRPNSPTQTSAMEVSAKLVASPTGQQQVILEAPQAPIAPPAAPQHAKPYIFPTLLVAAVSAPFAWALQGVQAAVRSACYSTYNASLGVKVGVGTAALVGVAFTAPKVYQTLARPNVLTERLGLASDKARVATNYAALAGAAVVGILAANNIAGTDISAQAALTGLAAGAAYVVAGGWVNKFGT